MHIIRKIVSGGQTGVDMAALDFGVKSHISVGGWCPKGRLNEKGKIPNRYPLMEASSSMCSVRTELNVMHSDATLIISAQKLIDRGTQLCIDLCKAHQKPYCIFDILKQEEEQVVLSREWLFLHPISILNVAGNRESTYPGIYFKALSVLGKLL